MPFTGTKRFSPKRILWRQSSDDLTRFARLHAITGVPEHAENYRRILDIRNGKAPYPEHYEQIYWDLAPESRQKRHPDGPAQPLSERIRHLPLLPKELSWLRESWNNSEELALLETAMFETFAAPASGETEKRRVRDSMFSEKYQTAKSGIMSPLDNLLISLDRRYTEDEKWVKQRITNLLIVLAAVLAAFVWFGEKTARFAVRNVLPAAGKETGAKIRRTAVMVAAAGAFMFVLGGGLFFVHYHTMKTAQDIALVHQVADEMRQSSDDLTRFARLYAITGDRKYAQNYQRVLDIRNGDAPRPLNYHHVYWELTPELRAERHPEGDLKSLRALLAETAILPEELALIHASQNNSDNLARLEVSMFMTFGDAEKSAETREEARHVLFGGEYLQYKSEIMEPVDDLLSSLNRRYAKTREESVQNIAGALAAAFAAAFAVFAALLFILAGRTAKAAGGGAP